MNVKAPKKSTLIFLKNDKISDEALNAWKALHIDPNMLIIKTKDSFKEGGVLPSIAEIRYFHYEDKRISLTDEVEAYIKSGGMNNTFTNFTRSNFLTKEFKKTRIGTGSPYHFSEKPDIPLRQPLEEESKSKRKAAKDIFEREKWEKVMQNKIELQTQEEKRIEEKKKKLTASEKKHKTDLDIKIKKAKVFNGKIEIAREREEKNRKDEEKKLLTKFKEAEKKRMLTKQRKLMEEKKHQKLIFENDQKYYFAQRNLSMTRKREEDAEVSKKLEEFERSMIQHEQKKQLQLTKASQRAESHISHVMDKLEKIKMQDPEEEKDYTELAKMFKKKIDASKNRDRHLKHLVNKKSNALRNQQEHVRMLIQSENRKNNDKQKYLMQRIKQKNNIVKEKDKLFEEQLLQRKEIQRLRRENQLYNFKREQMMSQDYKRRLIEKLQEKAIKGNRIKERIKTAATSTVGFLNMTVV